MPEGSRKYSKCHLNVLALADLPILPQRAVSQEIDNFLAAPHESGYGPRLPSPLWSGTAAIMGQAADRSYRVSKSARRRFTGWVLGPLFAS